MIVRLAVAVQPAAVVTVTVYVPAVDTVMEAVVCAPSLHKYVTPGVAVAVKVALVVTHVNGAGAFRLAVGNGFTVNIRVAVAVHPFASVIVTV